MGEHINIRIGKYTFRAELHSNHSADQFKRLLPITLEMKELNNNEKYAEIATSLPVDPAKPHMINAGDLMIWGQNTIVLFYDSFSTKYTYTALGKIAETRELVVALGKGNVSVTFELP